MVHFDRFIVGGVLHSQKTTT